MKKNVLFLSYTGILEPLGQSQVLSYVVGLTDVANFRLVTFEKEKSLKNTDNVKKLTQLTASSGVDWRHFKYHKTPRLLATLIDMWIMISQIVIFSLKNKNSESLIHCRSYVTTFCALVCSYFFKVNYIFDMRALWIDELVSSDRLKSKSLLFCLLKYFERKALIRACSVVSLTSAAKKYLCDLESKIDPTKVHVITTCVDLERFKPYSKTDSGIVIGVMGTITSGWFRQDLLFSFLSKIKAAIPNASITIISRDDQDLIKKFASKYDLDDIAVKACEADEVSKEISNFDIAAMFFKPETGKLGSAPTRLGELLACGIPVVCNSGVGDMQHLVSSYDVGFVLEDESKINELVNQVVEYTTELPGGTLKDNCIQASVDYFSLTSGLAKYKHVYNSKC